MEHGEMTERFRAFAQSVDPEPNHVARNALLIGGLFALLVVLVAVWVLLG